MNRLAFDHGKNVALCKISQLSTWSIFSFFFSFSCHFPGIICCLKLFLNKSKRDIITMAMGNKQTSKRQMNLKNHSADLINYSEHSYKVYIYFLMGNSLC